MKKTIKRRIKVDWNQVAITYKRPWWKFWSNGTFEIWINGKKMASSKGRK